MSFSNFTQERPCSSGLRVLPLLNIHATTLKNIGGATEPIITSKMSKDDLLEFWFDYVVTNTLGTVIMTVSSSRRVTWAK